MRVIWREAARHTVRQISIQPLIAPRTLSGNARLRGLRSWAVRIAHGKQDVALILTREGLR